MPARSPRFLAGVVSIPCFDSPYHDHVSQGVPRRSNIRKSQPESWEGSVRGRSPTAKPEDHETGQPWLREPGTAQDSGHLLLATCPRRVRDPSRRLRDPLRPLRDPFARPLHYPSSAPSSQTSIHNSLVSPRCVLCSRAENVQPSPVQVPVGLAAPNSW